jgi:hypothetical protein
MPAGKPAKNAAVPRTIRQIGRYIVADPQVCHGKLVKGFALGIPGGVWRRSSHKLPGSDLGG